MSSVLELPEIKSPVFVDAETTGLETHLKGIRIIGIGLCWAVGECCYIDLSKLEGEALLAELKLFEERILNNPAYEKWGQNFKYDIRMFAAAGLKYQNVTHDSNVLNYCIWGDRQAVKNGKRGCTGHGLDEMSLQYFNYIKVRTDTLIPRKTKKNPNPNMLQADQKLVSAYCQEDCDIGYRIILEQLKLLELPRFWYARRLYRDLEQPVAEVLKTMEITGVFIDLDRAKEIEAKLRTIQGRSIQQAKDICGQEFDIANRNHIEDIIFNKLAINADNKVEMILTKTGKRSTSKKVLEKFKDEPFVKAYLEAKAMEKNIGTYLEPIPQLIGIDGMVHGSFNQCITVTSRLSSSDPNLQNIPSRTEEGKLIRTLFRSRWEKEGGKILSADYSQVELRILAHMSDEPAFLEAFANNEDIHQRVASLIYGTPYKDVTKDQRSKSKSNNFGVIYGMGIDKLMSETGMTLEQANAFLAAYFGKLTKVKKWIDWAKNFVKEHGYAETLYGTRRYLPKVYSVKPYEIEAAMREGPNHKIQGTSANITKFAMIAIHKAIKESNLKSHMILQVHDELDFDVHPTELDGMKRLVDDIMPNVVKLKVPLVVESAYGSSWGEAH